MIEQASLRVIFVEDDTALREATVQGLELDGFQVTAFGDARQALRHLDRGDAGAVVSDIRLPGMDGLEFFEQLKLLDPELPVIFTTGHGDVAMAVEAMKGGAEDFLTKPYASAQLFASVQRAMKKRLLVLENRKLRGELGKIQMPRILGSSDQAERLRRLVAEVAATEIDLMVAGDSGTGKNFVARQIHNLSPRSNRPFVTVDAGIVAHKDAELLIFGREPGDGLGHSGLSRSGLIEKANGGTLFLDEIDAMPEAIQARLLSVVEDRTVFPIGADRAKPVNVRVISASRRSGGMGDVQTHAIATPLYHRLSGILITLPALADRREDIAEMFRHFVSQYERELEIEAKDISEAEWQHLASHEWHGNLRELRSFARNFVLGLSQLPQAETEVEADSSLKSMVERFERSVLEDALRHNNGRVTEVSCALNVQRKTLYDKLAKYNLRPADFRDDRAP